MFARTDDRWIALGVGFAAAVVYLAFGWDLGTDYDYYGRLAAALLDGRWWLDEAPPWLNELLPCGEGRHCVVYPPLPAILAVPLSFIGSEGAQVIVSRACGGASAGVLYLALRALAAPRGVALAGAAVSALGTTLLFTSVDGRAWFAAHSVAMLFTSVALLLAARGERGLLVGAAIGLAALSRLPIALAFPALALLAAGRSGRGYLPTLRNVVLGGLPFALILAGYDALRFGSPFDTGHGTLTLADGFYPYGLLSPLYLPRHLFAIFAEPPRFADGEWAFLRFSIVGMSLFLTTPALLWIFSGLRRIGRDRALRAVAICALLALLPNVIHGTVGFAQFGYRFSIDAQPFLIALAVAGDARDGDGWARRPSTLFLVAAAISIAINLYATVGITRWGLWE